jgi:hypothetical protein
VPIQALGMGDVHPTENELAALDEAMNIVPDADVIHDADSIGVERVAEANCDLNRLALRRAV